MYDTVAEAKAESGANVSVIYVPRQYAATAIDEAVDAGMDVVICITEGIPVRDMVSTRDRMRKSGSKTILVGPNCPGRHHAGPDQNRHHAGVYPQGRSGRRGVTLRGH